MPTLGDGTFTVVIDRLNQPTSLELIGKAAYVVTLGGEIWKIKGIQGPLTAPRVSNGASAGTGEGIASSPLATAA